MKCKDCILELNTANAYSQRGKLRAWCKDCWRERYTKPAMRLYRLRNPLWLRANKLAYQHRKAFGGLREEVLERDGYRCVHCGMTQDEHLAKWNCSLSLDHIDGRGCNVPVERKNNDPSNLQTLCLSCHGKKDVQRRGQVAA